MAGRKSHHPQGHCWSFPTCLPSSLPPTLSGREAPRWWERPPLGSLTCSYESRFLPEWFRIQIGITKIIPVMSRNFTSVPEWDLFFIFILHLSFFHFDIKNDWEWGLHFLLSRRVCKVQNKGFLENLEEFACKIDEDGYSIWEDLKYSFNLFNADKTVQVF